MLRSLFAAAALFATPVSAAVPDPSAGTGWRWEGAADGAPAIDLDLVRADVRIEGARNAKVSVSVVPAGANVTGATVDIVATDGAVRVRDRHPRVVSWLVPAECLPPADERGAFSDDQTRFTAVIRVPPGTRVRVRLIAGDVAVSGVKGDFDLATNGGMVTR